MPGLVLGYSLLVAFTGIVKARLAYKGKLAEKAKAVELAELAEAARKKSEDNKGDTKLATKAFEAKSDAKGAMDLHQRNEKKWFKPKKKSAKDSASGLVSGGGFRGRHPFAHKLA